MNKAFAVIGANFGDEGKGLITDYLVNTEDSNLVVRFNGGAQAGHTVVTPNGDRHVFGHLGAGTMSGIPTLLSRFFIINPPLFLKEMRQLQTKLNGKSIEVRVDSRAPVTTPFDMIFNQAIEMKRGSSRHGSCGVGIGETIERVEKFKPLMIADLFEKISLRKHLEDICDYWIPARQRALGLTDEDIFKVVPFSARELIDRFIQDIHEFLDNITTVHDVVEIKRARSPVFEGAQGLLLDQNNLKFFPHVTRSNTGLTNIVELINEAGAINLQAIYATRTYLTRHGAGFLPNEINNLPFSKIKDETNIQNTWQGSLRFAHLDLDMLKKYVYQDFINSSSKTSSMITPSLAVTCADQVDGDGEEFAKNILESVNFSSKSLVSFGKTRKDVIRM